MSVVLAYAAGIVDGEGCFTINRIAQAGDIHYNGKLAVRMCDKATIEWLHQEFGGSLYHHKAVAARNENFSAWQVHKRADLIFLIKQLLPYLRCKQIPARIVLEFCEMNIKGKQGRKASIEEKEISEQYFQLIQLANGRGPGSNEQKEKLRLVITGE